MVGAWAQASDPSLVGGGVESGTDWIPEWRGGGEDPEGKRVSQPMIPLRGSADLPNGFTNRGFINSKCS